MTLTFPYLSVDNQQKNELLKKKRNHKNLFNKLNVLYKTI